MQTGELPNGPWGSEQSRIWVRTNVAEGAGNHVFPAYHTKGMQWGLYETRIPMAWEITTGSPDVLVLIDQHWPSPDSENYGETNGVGLSSTNTQNNSVGRADLVMRILQQQSDGSFQLLDDAAQNSASNGNILVFEQFDVPSQKWVPSTGQLENGSGLGNASLRLSDYGHGLGTLSILAARHNEKGMLGIAPGCSYILRSGANTIPFGGNALDCDPTVAGIQMPHIVVANHEEPMPSSVSQSVFPAVHNLGFFPYLFTQHSNDDDCYPLANRRDQSAWLDTRAILAGVYNDGGLKTSEPCTNFDKSISLGKTYFNDNADNTNQQFYYYWDGIAPTQAANPTPNNVLYKPATNCGTSWTESTNCYRISSASEIRDNIGGEWTQYPDVVVPSDLFFEVNGEYYLQQQTDQSYVIAFVNGVLALMRSVDITGGINVTSQTLGSRPSNDGNAVCSNPLTVYTNTNLGTTNKYCTPAELTRRMRDVLTFTARQVANPTYSYIIQVGDVLQRAWALNTGYGMVDAYRSVAHSIPAKGAYDYSAQGAIDFTNATTINNRYYLHWGAWGRNADGDRQLLFDNQAFGYVPAGQPSTLHVGRTSFGTGTYTVGSSNTVCADGELVLGQNTTVKSAVNTDGRIMVSGYLSPAGDVGGSIEGNLTIGDLVVRSCTVKCSPSSNQDCRLYGTISVQLQGKLVLNAPGTTYVYPGSQIHMWGSNNLIVEGEGTILDLDYGSAIIAKDPTRKVIVRDGGVLRLRKGARAVNIDADVVIESGGKLELGSENTSNTTLNVKSLTVKTGGVVSIIGRGGVEPVIGQTSHVIVELDNNAIINIQPSAHFDLTYAMLKMNAGSTISLQSPEGDTLTLGSLDGASGIGGNPPTPPSRIDVKAKSVLQLAAQTGSSFVMRGLLFVDGDPSNNAIVQAKLMTGTCASSPAVPKLRIESVSPIFTGITVQGPDQSAAVNTGFRADRARFENVFVSLNNVPIVSGQTAPTASGFGGIGDCEFVANRSIVKTLAGFEIGGSMLSIHSTVNNITLNERADAIEKIRTVEISNCLFKDLQGLWSPNYYYTQQPSEITNQYSINGLTGTGLNTLRVNTSVFAYLFVATTTIGNYGGNWFTGNTVVHSRFGINDQLSQNWVCSNSFSEVQSGVYLDHSFFTRVHDNMFGSKVEGGGAFFEDDAMCVGTGVGHLNSNQLFMRNNTIHDYRTGLFALHGSQYLTTSNTRLYQPTPMTWSTRYEVEGRNVFAFDNALKNLNKYLVPQGGERLNRAHDLSIDATANLLVVCGYNSMALLSEYHLHRNEENPQGQKTILVDFNEWNFLDGTAHEYEVRPQPDLFQPIGDDLDDMDAVLDYCGPVIDNQDANCSVLLLFNDQGPTIRFNDGGFNDKNRSAFIVQSDRDIAIETMLNPAFCSARKYEAIGDALQLTILLHDSVAYRIFEAACDTLALNSALECYVRTKAAISKTVSLNASGMFSVSLAAIQQLKNSPMCSSDTIAISRMHRIVGSGVLDHVDSATYASLASMSRATIQEDAARHESDTLFQKPGVPGNDKVEGFSRSLLVTRSSSKLLHIANIGSNATECTVLVANPMGQLLYTATYLVPANSAVQVNSGEFSGLIFIHVVGGETKRTFPLLLE